MMTSAPLSEERTAVQSHLKDTVVLTNEDLEPFTCTEVWLGSPGKAHDLFVVNAQCHFDVEDPGNLKSGHQISIIINGERDGKTRGKRVSLQCLKNLLGKEDDRIVIVFDGQKESVTFVLTDAGDKPRLRATFKRIRDLEKDTKRTMPVEVTFAPSKISVSDPLELVHGLALPANKETKKRKIDSLGRKDDAPRKSSANNILSKGYNPINTMNSSNPPSNSILSTRTAVESPYRSSQLPPLNASSSPRTSPLRDPTISPGGRFDESPSWLPGSHPGLSSVASRRFYGGSDNVSKRTDRMPVFRNGMSNKENIALHQQMTGIKRDGFRNQGQTCYLNATLQLLYHLNRFKSALLRASQAVGDSDTDALEAEDLNCFEKSVSRALADVFRSKQNKDVVDPAALKRCIGLVLRQFANNDQEDAHELLYTLLDRVQMDFAPFEPPRGAVQNPVGANFVWELEQDMHCRECGYSSRKSDVFHDLSLDLPDEREFGGRTISLRTLVGKFFNDEIVEYKCEQSRDNAICPGREAILRRRIVRLPRFFLVHIKRYVIEARGRELAIVKRADSVGLDESLDFSRWCTDEAREPQTNEIDATDNDSGVSSLFAGTTKDDRIESQYADRPDLSKEGAFAKTKLNLDGMTEEEQIEYAVNESLRGSSEPPSEVIELDIEQDISQSASLKTVAKYSLQGVINHVGSNYNRGHYIADILDRKSNRWRTFNDDIMTTLGSFRDLCAKRARTVYILSFQLEE